MKTKSDLAAAYLRRKERARERNRRESIAGREIAQDFPGTPSTAFRPVGDLQEFQASFLPGSGIGLARCLWAALSGEHRAIALVGRTRSKAVTLLRQVRTALETCTALATAFPEVCYPIRRLEGLPQRRLLWQGQPIGGDFTLERIVLPLLPASQAAGVVIIAAKRGKIPTDCKFFEIDIEGE